MREGREGRAGAGGHRRGERGRRGVRVIVKIVSLGSAPTFTEENGTPRSVDTAALDGRWRRWHSNRCK